jgi:probable F420-dependent oxidoreductase
MSVRMGLSFGRFPFSGPAPFWRWIDLCEDSAVDSVWLSDRIASRDPFLEPMSALAAIAGRTKRLRFGSDVIVLPTRDPVMLAKQCATVDYLSEGRFFPMFGVGADEAPEWRALGISPQGRGARANEMLRLMTRLWTEDDVTFAGRYFTCDHLTLSPKPHQSPFLFWIGGASPAAIERTARYGQGWIGSSISTPAQTGAVVTAIKAKAGELGRDFEPDHFGAGFTFRFGSWGEPIVQRTIETLASGRARDADPRTYLAVGDADDMMQLVEALHEAGISKFVARPLASTDEEMLEQSRRAAEELIPRVNRLSPVH